MALTTPRIVGSQVTVTCIGAKTKWKSIMLQFVEEEENATAADSTQIESVSKRKGIVGKVTGLLGVANNGATLPQIGDAITDFAVAVGSDSVLPAITGFTNIKVVAPVTYNFEDGLANFEFNFKSGRLN